MQGSSYAFVILAKPTGQPPKASHSFWSMGPAALWMLPSTPVPSPFSAVLAAFTMASTFIVVMSCFIISSGMAHLSFFLKVYPIYFPLSKDFPVTLRLISPLPRSYT